MHYKKISHGDLKPENIMIKNDRIKIIDLGCARRVKSFYSGTEIYRAPEFYEDACFRVLSSDIWAFGLIVLEMLGGNSVKFVKYLKQAFKSDKNKDQIL